MRGITTGKRFAVTALAVTTLTGAMLLTGCNRQEDAKTPVRPVTGNPGGSTLPPSQPPPTDSLSALEETLSVQPARSTSDARLPQPWQDVTPTASADAGSRQTVRKWISPVVLIGRGQIWLGDKAVAPVHCQSKRAENCTKEALKVTGTVAEFGLMPNEIVEGKFPALSALIVDLKDKDVPVVADRRTTWVTVETIMATLRAAGARPFLAVASQDGELVDALGVGTGLPEAATLVAARKAAEPGESVPGSLPTDATALTILVTAGGIAVEIGRPEGEPARPEVLGNIVESLIALSDRLRTAVPTLTTVTIRVDGEVAMEQVIQVIDGLRDTCGRTAHGQRCLKRTQLFAVIRLETAGAAVEPAKVELEAPLRLDPAAPSGLHLSDKPATPGLHL